jgi:hypothetical protein
LDKAHAIGQFDLGIAAFLAQTGDALSECLFPQLEGRQF